MSTDEKNIKKSNKPKIISIVKVDKPIKLMKLNEKSGNNENKNTNVDYNHVPLNDASNIQNIKENFKEVDMPKTSIKSLSDNIIISTTSIEQNENKNKTLKSEKYEKTKEANVSKKNCMKSIKEKENKTTIDKKRVKSVTIKSPNLDILKHKNRLYSSGTNTKKLNATNKKSVSVTTKKNSKPIVGVMPCYKYKKVESNIKTPVKKTVIRDIIGSKIKPSINPGIDKIPDNLKFLEIDENIVKPLISGKELAKPEYNSIMSTISKLNELKKQKVIPDIEHLPASYKNLISGKVSTALDFPLDEVIYKNLVDLSIDENQLPSRLTRSKDPEPRQKDIVPILSDFFTPISIDEYCTPVSVKPRSSETIDYWNAFRISDQIYEWKHTLNHI